MTSSQTSNKTNNCFGFTIVELLVVIVVIGILATITIISYTGISQKATISSIQSDLTNFSKQLKIFQVEKMLYPDTVSNCSTTPDSSTNKCLKLSGGNVIANYVRDNTITPQGFCLNITNGTLSYKITSTKYNVPTVGDCNPTVITQDFSYTGSPQTWTVPTDVISVSLEVWGAQGAGSGGGKGGYSKGNLAVVAGHKLGVYVGGQSGFNGGGVSDIANGGDATDIRYNSTSTASTAFADRKIIAGGGGGGDAVYAWGGVGGGTSAGSGNSNPIAVPSQTTGSDSTYYYQTSGGNYGAGGGYRVSYSMSIDGCGPEGGEYTCSPHGGSGYVGGVTNSTITAGNATMPNPAGGTMTGRSGNGFARISWQAYDF